MAKSLKIKIEMAGAEEIQRQLEGVGEAGEAAFKKIVSAAEQAGGFNKLDPSTVTQAFEQFGVKGSAAVDKVTQAVKTAARMETMIGALTSVENGLAKVQTAASAVDNVLSTALVKSLSLVARGLAAAFSAAVVGSIASTTKALTELDAMAIQLGRSLGDVAKAEEIFRSFGMSAKEAAKGVAEFDEKATLKNVKAAIADLDEFGRSAKAGSDSFRILEAAAKLPGEAGELSRTKLQELGRLKIDAGLAQELDKIGKSSASMSDKLLQTLGVFEKMGNTSERNAAIFSTFGKEFGTAIIQMLNAGVSTKDIAKDLEKMKVPTEDTAKAAALLSLEWAKLTKVIGSGFEVSPEGLKESAAVLKFIRESLEAIGKSFTEFSKSSLGAGFSNIGPNTLREFQAIKDIGPNTLREFQAIKDFFTGIGGTAANAWNALVQGAQAAATNVGQFFSNLPGQIAGFFTGLGSGLWEGFVQGASAAATAVVNFFSNLPGQIAGFFSGFGSGLWNSLVQGASAAATAVVNFFSNLPGQIAGFFTGLGSGLWEGFVQGASAAAKAVVNFFSNLPGQIAGYFMSLGSDVWNSLVASAKAAAAKIKGFFSGVGFSGGGAVGAHASGGFIGGRGTGTSDSNLAWVSRGEHIMPARAVSQPGVLAFLEALRRSGGNLGNVLDRMGHFALGGLVGPMAVPAFAGGGMSHVTIAFPGLPPIGGLRASSAVVDELRRAAAMAQVRSGGRKPSRYG